MRLIPTPMVTCVAASLLMAACASQSPSPSPSAASSGCAPLVEASGWYGENHQRLSAMIEELGDCGGSGEVADGAPLALFDWDNTVVKNDIGDATTFWMLANGKVLQPADWAKVSSFITPEAAAALRTACAELAEPDQPLPTNTEAGAGCADEIASVYAEGVTRGGAAAFAGYNHRRIEPQYAFAAQLLAGYTEDEVMGFARQAREQSLAAEEGATQVVGTTEVKAWVRYYEQITDLIAALRGNGFDVRIVSASAEPVVRVWAEPLGLASDRVMGVTQVADAGKLTTTLTPCGGDAEAMTYIEGKRCRVNEEVFQITGAAAFEPAPENQRSAFAAGDSDTDVSFMIDATALKLVINRNKVELMCHAYDNEDGTWIINPMFIDPLGRQAEPYPCATKGEILPDGGAGPLHDVNGNLIENQEDTVFG